MGSEKSVSVDNDHPIVTGIIFDKIEVCIKSAGLDQIRHTGLLIESHFKQHDAAGFKQEMGRKKNLSDSMQAVDLSVEGKDRFEPADLGLKAGDAF